MATTILTNPPTTLQQAKSASRLRPTTPTRGTEDIFGKLLAEQGLLIRSRLPLPAAPAGETGISEALIGSLPDSSPLQLNTLLTRSLLDLIMRTLAGIKLSGYNVPAGLPVAGQISQPYHSGHRAVDIAVPVGTPVRTTTDGRVVYAGWNQEGYGNLVIVENGAYRTYYAHLDRIPVEKGEIVEAGAIVGFSGNTGNSTGPHLHYEVRINGVTAMPNSTGRLLG